MLEGIRILDLTWVLGGPFGGQLLAQLGAEVIKVEPPKGDSSRTIPPYWVEEDSAYFLSVNRGKKAVGIDLRSERGLKAFYDLVREADAVIYGFAPDVPKRLGIDFDTLKSINPRICVGQLIGLHDEGEYTRAPAYDLIVQALGGVMSITGSAGQPPSRVGYQVADLAGGLYLALGTVGALLRSARKGEATHVQISLLDCQLSLLTWQAQNYLVGGSEPTALGSRNPMIAPSEAFRCADGHYLAISPTGEHFWTELCAAIGQPELAEDERFNTRTARLTNVDALAEILSGVFVTKDAGEWADEFFAKRIPAAQVLSVGEALRQPLAMLRSMVEPVQHPRTGAAVQMVGNPFKYAGSASLPYPPAFGADTRDVFTGVCGYTETAVDELITAGALYEGGEKYDMAL